MRLYINPVDLTGRGTAGAVLTQSTGVLQLTHKRNVTTSRWVKGHRGRHGVDGISIVKFQMFTHKEITLNLRVNYVNFIYFIHISSYFSIRIL